MAGLKSPARNPLMSNLAIVKIAPFVASRRFRQVLAIRWSSLLVKIQHVTYLLAGVGQSTIYGCASDHTTVDHVIVCIRSSWSTVATCAVVSVHANWARNTDVEAVVGSHLLHLLTTVPFHLFAFLCGPSQAHIRLSWAALIFWRNSAANSCSTRH